MAKIYYPKSSLILSKSIINQAGIEYTSVTIDAPASSIIVFGSGSFSSDTIISASLSSTSSYALNALNSATIDTGSFQPITTSYAINSVIGGNGKLSSLTWGAESFIEPTAPWTTGSPISMSYSGSMPYHIWTGSYQQPFLIPDPVYIPKNATHVRFNFNVRTLNATNVAGVRFNLQTRNIRLRETEAWSSEVTCSKYFHFDCYLYESNGRGLQAKFEIPLSDMKLQPKDLVKFWFARDINSTRDDAVTQDWGIQSVTIEPFTARPIPSGSLKEALISKSMAVVSGKTYPVSRWKYLSKDTASFTYVLSGSRLDNLAGFDTSGFCVWNSTRLDNSPGYLVSPEHIITVNHYDYNVGAKLHFVDNAGNTHTRSIAARIELPNTTTAQNGDPFPDTSVHRLNSPLPPSIAWYRTMPPDFYKYFIQGGRGVPIWFYIGPTDSYTCHEVDTITPANYPYVPGVIATMDPVENSSSFRSWFQAVVSGNSGSPKFFIMPDGEIIPVAAASTMVITVGSYDCNSPMVCMSPVRELVNAAIVNLGTSSSYTSLQTCSLANYPILTDYGYET